MPTASSATVAKQSVEAPIDWKTTPSMAAKAATPSQATASVTSTSATPQSSEVFSSPQDSSTPSASESSMPVASRKAPADLPGAASFSQVGGKKPVKQAFMEEPAS